GSGRDPRSSVNPALGLAGAGPTPRARVLPRSHPPSAGRAPDGRVAVARQRVDREVMLTLVSVDVRAGPPHQWVDLDQPVRVVPGHDGGLRPRGGLVAADPAHPR